MTTSTLREFADLLGVKPSYVTKLKQADRLVLLEDGRVDVEASQQRIEDTRDPNRDDVQRRHAEARRAAEAGEETAGEDNAETAAEDNSVGYTKSRAMKEQYLALSAKLEYERASGKLVETEAVKRAGDEAGTALRAVLENLPDQLAPLLAPVTDEAKVHALLVENIEIILLEISGKMEAAGRALTEVKL
jgi:hypothetical protein